MSEIEYINIEDMHDYPMYRLTPQKLNPVVDYLPNDSNEQIKHVIQTGIKASGFGVGYHESYVMLAAHTATVRGIMEA